MYEGTVYSLFLWFACHKISIKGLLRFEVITYSILYNKMIYRLKKIFIISFKLNI